MIMKEKILQLHDTHLIYFVAKDGQIGKISRGERPEAKKIIEHPACVGVKILVGLKNML